jgi:hypothetical protein
VTGTPWSGPALAIVAVAGAGMAGQRWALTAAALVVLVGAILAIVLTVAGGIRRRRPTSAVPTSPTSPSAATNGRIEGPKSPKGSGCRTDLRGARLTNGRLAGADLRGADLRGADLRGADLTDADLTGALLGLLEEAP